MAAAPHSVSALTKEIALPVKLSASVGRVALNRSPDVQAVEDLLQFICADEAYNLELPVTRVESHQVCVGQPISRATAANIENFQRAVGLAPTGNVDPLTLQCMNDIATPLEWDRTPPSVSQWAVDKEDLNEDVIPRFVLPYGYYVNHKGKIPSSVTSKSAYRVLLHLHSATTIFFLGRALQGMLLSNSIEIPGTAQPNQIRGLLDEEKLLKLLEIINTNSLWGKKVLATLLVVRQTLDRKVLITCSSSEFLHAPVAPYGFDVESKLGVENLGDSRSIPYVGEGQGRVLTKNKLGKNYYFVLSKRFEVDEKMRGFDCSSFVGSAFHIAPEDPPGGPTSSVYRKNETLVQAIGVDSAKTHTVANTTECKVNLEELPLGKITGDAGMKKLPATLKSKSGSNCTIELKTSIGDVSTLTVPAKRVSEERKTTTAEVFFKEHPSGTYIAHSSGHFVLVKNGELHEFNSHLPRDKGRAVWAQKGYFHQAASTWSGWGAGWTIYKTNKNL